MKTGVSGNNEVTIIDGGYSSASHIITIKELFDLNNDYLPYIFGYNFNYGPLPIKDIHFNGSDEVYKIATDERDNLNRYLVLSFEQEILICNDYDRPFYMKKIRDIDIEHDLVVRCDNYDFTSTVIKYIEPAGKEDIYDLILEEGNMYASNEGIMIRTVK